MKENSFKAYEQGRKIALIEKSLVSGFSILPIVVECLQSNYSLSDYGLFFEGYNFEIEREK